MYLHILCIWTNEYINIDCFKYQSIKASNKKMLNCENSGTPTIKYIYTYIYTYYRLSISLCAK